MHRLYLMVVKQKTGEVASSTVVIEIVCIKQ